MFAPIAFAVALLMTITSTVCWGSWSNTYKLTRNYRFELFYWDYAFGIFAMALLLALTLGSTAQTPERFLFNLSTATPSNLWLAAIGGFIFNIANVLLVAGIDIAGLAIAFPISIGIALVEGVLLSYVIQPKGHLGLLLTGVGFALLAVVLIGKAYGELGS